MALLCLILACGMSADARADSGLAVSAATPGQIRVDGALSDWRGARFTRIGSDPSGSAEVALAYEASGLFIGARVHDDTFVRSDRPSAREDALVASLAFPLRGAFVPCELWLYAGEMGKSAAQLQLRSGRDPTPKSLRAGVQIVEGPSPGGYALEAFVPWSSFNGGEDWAFARGALRLHDVDAGRTRELTSDSATKARSSSPPTAAELPYLWFDGGAAQNVAAFLRERNLEATKPKLDFVGDVQGDARAERVIVVATFVVVGGADNRIQFTELPIQSGGDVERVELLELTGDAKPELVLHLRQQDDLGSSQLVRVFGFSGAAPESLFGAETRRQTRDGFVSAKLELARGHGTDKDKGGRPSIVIKSAEARGLSAQNYREARVPDRVPVPLPWGTWLERVYGWDGQRFALLTERKNLAATAPESSAATPVRTAPQRTAAPPAAASQPSAEPGAPIEAYKRARGIAADTPARFAQSANVAGDAKPESLVVFGTELVVTGAGLGGDVGFFYLGLPVQDAADVLGVQTADVTGDGRRELLARVRQRIGDVQRELLFCYTLTAQSSQQLLAVEVSRIRGAQRIDNTWSLVPDKQRVVLTIEPGTARGWSAKDYPFVSDSHGGIAPLLLPWKDRTTRYVFQANQLVRDPRTND